MQRDGRLEHREEPVLAARLELGRVPVGPHQEPAPHGGFVADEVLDREPPGRPARRRVVPLGVVGRVRLLADLQGLGELRTPPGRVRERLQVGPGHGRAIRVVERGVRGGPLLASRRLASAVDHGCRRRCPLAVVATSA